MSNLLSIPDKEFFTIGEVSRITDVPAYVLRYWESEFRILRPARRVSGQRKYIKNDVARILRVKDLLYIKKFTIAGAKKHLLSEKKSSKSIDASPSEGQLNFDIKTENLKDSKAIKEITSDLESILDMLKK